MDPTHGENAASKLDQVLGPRFENFIKTFDAHIDNFVHEHLDNIMNTFMSWLGDKVAGIGTSTMAKMDRLSEKVSPPAAPTIGEMKKMSGPEIGQSITPDIALQAQVAVGIPNRFQVMDMADHNHNFFPTATPGLGYAAGQSYGMSV